VYVAYAGDSTDWASTGVDLTTYATRAQAETACNQQAACIGMKSNGSSWKTFAGVMWEGVTSKVRVSGAAINTWIPEPAAN